MKENRLSNQKLTRFCRGLSLLLQAGIPLGEGLFLLAEGEEGSYRLHLEKMGKAVEAGKPLAEAMEEIDRFPTHVTGMVRVGQQTGFQEETLHALAKYYEERERIDRQLRNSLTYPIIVMLVMLVVIGVLLIRVLPVFDKVYASLGGQLTGVAGKLLHIGQILKDILPILCILLAIVVVFVLAFTMSKCIRQKTLTFWNKYWGDTGIAKKQNDAHFAQALAMGLKSGLPVEESVALAGSLLQDVPAAAKRYEECAKILVGGSDLTRALQETKALPVSACRMLEIGMQSGNGDVVMGEIADQLSQEAAQALEEKIAQVEPTMVLTASILVGIILLSVMLPLMDIMSAIG